MYAPNAATRTTRRQPSSPHSFHLAKTYDESDLRRRVNQHQLNSVRASFACVEPCGAAFLSHALQRICVARPNIAAYVREDQLARTSQKLFDTLRAFVQHGDRFHTLEQPLAILGAKSEAMGLTTADLLGAKDELLRCLRDACGNDWTWQTQNAWTMLLDAVVAALAAGAHAARERKSTPAQAAA